MTGFRSPRLIATALVVVGGTLGLAPAAGAARRPATRTAAAAPAKPFLDVRDAAGAAPAPAPSAAPRAARSRLRREGAAVSVDPQSGTPRLVAGRAAPLSAPAPGDRREIAERYVRGHLAALGLSRTDLGSLTVAQRSPLPAGA